MKSNALEDGPVQIFYKCPICGTGNPFVNRCGCDKNNLPTVPKSNREWFLEIYAQCLTVCLAEHPEEYAWPAANIPVVVQRMAAAMDRNTFNHTSRGLSARVQTPWHPTHP